MIYLYTVIFLSTLQLLSIGYLVEKFLFKTNFEIKKIGIYGINSLFILGFLSLVANFFLPISKLLNTIFLIIPIFFIFFYFKLFFKKKIIICIISISLFSFITICLSNNYNPDAGLYHLPYVRLLNDSKIILGVTNINFTLGQSSFFQYIASTYNSFIFKENGIVIPLVQIYSFIIFSLIYYLISSKKVTYSYFLIFLITCFCLIRINRYSEFGNDAPGHLLYFFLIYLILQILEKKTYSEYDFFNISLISVFAFITKPTLIFIFLFNIFLLFRFKFFKFFRLKTTYLFIFFIFIYFIKNLMVSGCILYPIKITCIDNLDWYSTNIEHHGNSERVHDQGQAWTKGFPDHPQPQKSFKDYNTGFYWISIWYKNHGYIITKKFTPVFLFFAIIILLNLYFSYKTKNKVNNKSDIGSKDLISLLLITGFSSLYWFLNFPVLRYGLGYVGGFILLLFSLLYKEKMYIGLKTLNNLLIFLCILIIFKNSNRIIKNYNLDYEMNPWPSIYGFDRKINNKDQLTKIYKDKEFYFYAPNKSSLCFFNYSPCTHFNSQKILSEVELTKRYNFKTFKIKNK